MYIHLTRGGGLARLGIHKNLAGYSVRAKVVDPGSCIARLSNPKGDAPTNVPSRFELKWPEIEGEIAGHFSSQ